MVLGTGVEPARLTAGDFKSHASTNFAIRARSMRFLSIEHGSEVWPVAAPVGCEPEARWSG